MIELHRAFQIAQLIFLILLQNIIQLQQGVVVTSLEELKDQNDYIRIVISELVDTEDYHQYEGMYAAYMLIFCSINVIYDKIH